MLDCDPDWAPSLNLGHAELPAATPDRFNRLCRRTRLWQKESAGHASEPPTQTPNITGLVTEMDNVAPSDNTTPLAEMEETTSDEAALICQADDAPEENVQELQNCSMFHLRLKEILLLQEENRKLKGALSRKTLDENFLKDNDSKNRTRGLNRQRRSKSIRGAAVETRSIALTSQGQVEETEDNGGDRMP
ncbi:uncharacterized protein KZ484_001156 [Pholidichthys leucotaenia]